AGQKVVYGIRPEHLKPGAEGITAKVSVVEPTGPELHIYADLGDHEVCSITQDRLALRPGDTVHLAPALDRVHLYDQESGKAIFHG
ncbi:MAG: TOBE domain-containing protein, partial [bacterium]